MNSTRASQGALGVLNEPNARQECAAPRQQPEPGVGQGGDEVYFVHLGGRSMHCPERDTWYPCSVAKVVATVMSKPLLP